MTCGQSTSQPEMPSPHMRHTVVASFSRRRDSWQSFVEFVARMRAVKQSCIATQCTFYALMTCWKRVAVVVCAPSVRPDEHAFFSHADLSVRSRRVRTQPKCAGGRSSRRAQCKPAVLFRMPRGHRHVLSSLLQLQSVAVSTSTVRTRAHSANK